MAPSLADAVSDISLSYRVKEQRFPLLYLIDAFLVYVLVPASTYRGPKLRVVALQATGLLQWVYCFIFGSFPFNAFLSG